MVTCAYGQDQLVAVVLRKKTRIVLRGYLAWAMERQTTTDRYMHMAEYVYEDALGATECSPKLWFYD